MKRFLLVDDHAVIRTALKIILQNMYGPVEAEEAHDGDSALEKLKQDKFSMIILDVSMPGTDSFNLVDNILARQPDAKILMFSMNPEEVYARRYLQMGVKGYLKKDAPEPEIRKAIDTVLNNKRYISSSLAESLVNNVFEQTQGNPFDHLSPREFEICQHLVKGDSVGDISRKLHLNTSTISSHKGKIFQKLGVHNQIELNKLATAFNIVQ
ncbi:MAG: response regulator [Flavisolibacter sp.]